MKKKSVIEEAILEAQAIEEALKLNAKEILTSNMKGEIEEMVKESLVTEEDEEDDSDVDTDVDTTDDMDAVDTDVDTDTEMPTDDVDADSADTEFDAVGDAGTDDFGAGEELGGGFDDTLDLTAASDDEIIKVFKKLSDEDEVEVTQSNGAIHLKDASNEYRIEVPGLDGGDSFDTTDDFGGDMGGEEEMVPVETGDDFESEEDTDMDVTGAESGAEMGGMDDEGMDVTGAESDTDMDTESDELDDFTEGIEGDDEVVYEIEYEDELDESSGPDTSSDEGFNNKKGDVIPFKGKKQKSPVSGNVVPESEEIMGDEAGFGPDTSSDEGFNQDKGDILPFKGKKQKSPVSGNVVPESEDLEETSARTNSNGRYRSGNRYPQTFPNERKRPSEKQVEQFKKAYIKLFNENKQLKAATNQFKKLNEEYRNALNHFRGKLQEVAVFNSNLAYATKLFTEHSTTKDEKVTILKRFDNVKTLKESRSLYKTLVEEFDTKAPMITENINNKINKTPASGSKIVESVVYKDPSFQRTLDLINKIK